jgi:hypothetical protein
LAAALAVTGVIAAGAILLLGHHGPASPTTAGLPSLRGGPPVPDHSPANRQAFGYLARAEHTVISEDKTCWKRPLESGGFRPPVRGAPSPAILSSFSVLRQPAQARQPKLPGLLARREGVFVDYVRVAQRRFGSMIEVAPTKDVGAGGISAHCARAELAALNAQLRDARAPVRAHIQMVAGEVIADQRYIAQHPEGMCLFGAGGGCLPLLYALTQGGLTSGGSGGNSSVWTYLVPDGVATITAQYPQEGPNTGFQHNFPPRTVTARVINNVAMWRLANEPGDIFPSTIMWHAHDGTTLRTVHPN